MERICPWCNGLQATHDYCPRCGHVLVDKGSLQDFYGPYSPYMEQQAGEDLVPAGGRDLCVHLLYCPSCGYDRRAHIKQIIM